MIIIDEPLLNRVHRLASPAFPVTAPRLQDQALIPVDVRRSLHSIWDANVMPVRAVDFYRLRDVYVCADGLVFDARGQLYRSSVGQHSAARIEEAAEALGTARQAGTHVGFGGPAVLCKQAGRGGYQQWMLEALPRALLARGHLQLRNLRYIISEPGATSRAAVRESLVLAGIGEGETITVDSMPQFFEDLILIDGITGPGAYLSPLAVTCLDPLTEQIPPGQAARIYITRQTAGWRRLKREEALIRIAEREGYVVVNPDTMRLVQRIGIFKGAQRILGVIGAPMTNIMFAPSGCRVGQLVPASMPDSSYWFISQIRRHHYTEHRCAEMTDDASSLRPAWDSDITITRDAFRNFVGML